MSRNRLYDITSSSCSILRCAAYLHMGIASLINKLELFRCIVIVPRNDIYGKESVSSAL